MRRISSLALCALVFFFGGAALLKGQQTKQAATKQQTAPTTTEKVEPPKTTLSISLERATIREGEPLPVVVSFSNDSALPLTDVKLSINAPAFVELRVDNCKGTELKEPLLLGSVPASSTIKPRQLCLSLKPDLSTVGAYNLLFTAEYAWKAADGNHQSAVTSEKAITVDLIGTDKIVGVPLAFAGFIVPGLFFWVFLRMMKVPLALNLEADEKLILSIIVSVFCIGVAFLLSRLLGWWWLKYFDISNNISLTKLLFLALSGTLLGLGWGGYYQYRQNEKRKAEQALLIGTNETMIVLLEKILGLNPEYTGNPVLVRLKNGDTSEYVGSHWAKTVDATYLVGSFRVNTQELSAATKTALQPHQEPPQQPPQHGNHLIQTQKNLLEVLALLKPADAGSVEVNSGILRYEGKTKTVTNKPYYKWSNDEVSAVIPDWNRGLKLLDLA